LARRAPEYDFVYQLTVGGEPVRDQGTQRRQITRIYEGPEYRAFSKQVTGLVEEADPQFKKLMTDCVRADPPGRPARRYMSE